MHIYKIIAFSDISGTRKEAASRYADNPAQALQIYNEYSNAKDEDGNSVYSLVMIQTAVYKTVPISDFQKMYNA